MSSWAVMLQGSPRRSCPPATRSRAKGGGDGGIRTLDRALQPYNGLANRRLQPLGHSSVEADMPDARASRKRQIQIVARNEIRRPRWQDRDAFVSARVQKATAGERRDASSGPPPTTATAGFTRL